MSSPPATPSKTTDPNMGLSATEIRILLLGIVHSAEGKVSKYLKLHMTFCHGPPTSILLKSRNTG